MNILKSETNLYKPIENLTLIKELIHLCLSFYVVTEITDLTVLHNYDQHV